MKSRKVILPLFLPHTGCSKHCSFCDQRALTYGGGENLQGMNGFREKANKFRVLPDEVAIYGGDPLNLPDLSLKSIISRMEEITMENMGQTFPLRVSATPKSLLAWGSEKLVEWNISTVEVGIVSTDEAVLKRAGRDYSREEAIMALRILKGTGITTGVQLLTGLPHEGRRAFLQTLEDIFREDLDFAILYPLHIFRSTSLGKEFEMGSFTPKPDSYIFNSAVLFVLYCMAFGIKIGRVGLSEIDLNQGDVLYRHSFRNLRQEGEGGALSILVDLILKREDDVGKILISEHLATSFNGIGGRNRDLLMTRHPELDGKVAFHKSAEGVEWMDGTGKIHSLPLNDPLVMGALVTSVLEADPWFH
jgi:histone acetyltransferase (RNA polymerase elongator complex component)